MIGSWSHLSEIEALPTPIDPPQDATNAFGGRLTELRRNGWTLVYTSLLA